MTSVGDFIELYIWPLVKILIFKRSDPRSPIPFFSSTAELYFHHHSVAVPLFQCNNYTTRKKHLQGLPPIGGKYIYFSMLRIGLQKKTYVRILATSHLQVYHSKVWTLIFHFFLLHHFLLLSSEAWIVSYYKRILLSCYLPQECHHHFVIWIEW